MSLKNINPSSKIKKLLSIAVFGALIIVPNMKAYADVYVNGYQRSNGTYVDPHYRTSPNNTIYDNYSTWGNSNPYTGQKGYYRGY